MSDLLRSAFGYFNNPGGPGGVSGPQQGGGAHQSQHGGVGQGSSDETSAIGDVISFQGSDQLKRSVRIQKLIAEGGFSYVYRGVDTSSNELVAIKKMLAPDPDALKAIEQEVEFLRQFQHDNIIKFYGSIMRPSGRLKEYFIAMEYCQVPLPTPPLRQQHTTQVFGQTCKAIKYLHDFGIVHRDIKLENVLIGPDGLVRLVDFGSATMEKIYPSPDWSMSKRTIIEEQIAEKTTPMYRSPEMLDLWSNHPIDEHSDMWALGCLLYALNFGQHPFQDSNKLAITNANYTLPKNVSDSNPLVCIIRGLLKVNPLERISFGQICELLQSIAECENFSLNGPLPFKPVVSPIHVPGGPSLNLPPSQAAAVGNGAGPHRPPPGQSSQQGGSVGGGGLLSSIKGVGSNLLKNIKEQSQQYMYGPGLSGGPVGPPERIGPGASAPPPSRPPPPGGSLASQAPPPPRPAPPSPRMQPKSGGHLEFENREYDLMQERQQHGPPSRPAPPKPPPPTRPNPSPEPTQAAVGNLLDISLDSSVNSQPAVGNTQPLTNSNLLDDLFGSAAPQSQQSSNTPAFATNDLLWGNTTSSLSTNNKATSGEMNLLGDTTDPFASLLGKSAPATTATSPNPPFGQPLGGTPLIQPGMGGIPTSSSFQNLNFPKNMPGQPPLQNMGAPGLDPFGGPVGKPVAPGSIPKNSSTPNFLSEQILGDLMGLGMGGGGAQKPNGPPPPSAASANNANKSNPTINLFGNGNGNGAGSKPNYHRHQIFDAKSPTEAAPEKKQTLNDAFGDILSSQGFASTSKGNGGPRTMNDLRKIDLLQNPNVDPVQFKVNEWREGKKKNIRALLASLHTVTWEECNWKETNMSEMITPAQVKKVYRKACLAIHPDKQMGKEWEQLAKLLFVELNEAWAAFEEQQQT